MIYGYLLTTEYEVVDVRPRYQHTPSTHEQDHVKRVLGHLQSLRLNKATYSEASRFFYGRTWFCFDFAHGDPRSALEIKWFFLSLRPASRLAVRKLFVGIERGHVQSCGWTIVCAYLATQAALSELNIRVCHGSGPCDRECAGRLSNLDSQWAKALSRIHDLKLLSIHTLRCQGECGFDDDGNFNESDVREPDTEGFKDYGEEEVLCTMVVGCFRREFVEGLRAKMVKV